MIHDAAVLIDTIAVASCVSANTAASEVTDAPRMILSAPLPARPTLIFPSAVSDVFWPKSESVPSEVSSTPMSVVLAVIVAPLAASTVAFPEIPTESMPSFIHVVF